MLISNRVEGKTQLIATDPEGRWVKLSIQHKLLKDSAKFILLCVYAPNSETDRVAFFSQQLEHIIQDCDMIIGDFNVKLSRLDYHKDSNFKYDGSRSVLLNIMDKFDLCDLWRTINPGGREFTRLQWVKGVVRQSRVDLCLVKRGELKMYTDMKHKYTVFSDHVFLEIKLNDPGRVKAGGLWHFNAALLRGKKNTWHVLKN